MPLYFIKMTEEKKITKEVKFDQLGLNEDILATISKKGFKVASEIQAKAIPIILEGKHDVVGLAQTGTGKTGAFGLPLIQNIEVGNKSPKAIILAPTRELAIQVCDELSSFRGNKKLKTITVYGGTNIDNQIKDLRRGMDIVVGTPGRVLDLIKRRALKLDEIEYFVLDEADEMLKMGFIDDIEMIFDMTPKDKQVLLFSATMLPKIKTLTKKYMKDQIIIQVEKKQQKNDLIDQVYYKARYSEKFDAISRIVDVSSFFYGIIFCKTKADVDELTANLRKAGYDADCIHGDIAQNRREKILQKFKDLKISILVATDVAARGIDVDSLTHVINHSLPQESETYIHRIGRTGRAGKKGTAITLVTPKEVGYFGRMGRELNIEVKEGKLPTQKDIVLAKTDKITKKVDKTIESAKHHTFQELSNELLSVHDPEQVVSALLYQIHGKEEIKSEKRESRNDSRDRNSRDRDGRDKRKPRGVDLKSSKTRIFIAKGKLDNLDKKGLINFIEKECNMDSLRANEVKVCDKFSFMTLPSREADKVVKTFSKKNSRRPLVEVASD